MLWKLGEITVRTVKLKLTSRFCIWGTNSVTTVKIFTVKSCIWNSGVQVWDLRSKACISTKFAGSSCNDLVTSDQVLPTIDYQGTFGWCSVNEGDHQWTLWQESPTVGQQELQQWAHEWACGWRKGSSIIMFDAEIIYDNQTWWFSDDSHLQVTSLDLSKDMNLLAVCSRY